MYLPAPARYVLLQVGQGQVPEHRGGCKAHWNVAGKWVPGIRGAGRHVGCVEGLPAPFNLCKSVVARPRPSPCHPALARCHYLNALFGASFTGCVARGAKAPAVLGQG